MKIFDGLVLAVFCLLRPAENDPKLPVAKG